MKLFGHLDDDAREARQEFSVDTLFRPMLGSARLFVHLRTNCRSYIRPFTAALRPVSRLKFRVREFREPGGALPPRASRPQGGQKRGSASVMGEPSRDRVDTPGIAWLELSLVSWRGRATCRSPQVDKQRTHSARRGGDGLFASFTIFRPAVSKRGVPMISVPSRLRGAGAGGITAWDTRSGRGLR